MQAFIKHACLLLYRQVCQPLDLVLLAQTCLLKAGERETFIDNLLAGVHWIIEVIAVKRPCAMGV